MKSNFRFKEPNFVRFGGRDFFSVHWGVVESGQVESGQDYFDWRSTRYFTKTVESGLVESGQNEQTS